MKEIKIILLIISITFISCSKEDQILVPEVPDPYSEWEASIISWDKITGKIAYKKNNTLYLADKTSRTVRNLGICTLSNLKWNKAGNEITGIPKVGYSLEAYDLNGNHYELDKPSSFSSRYYDWLPDGRLAHITNLGYVHIENSKLIDEKFNAFGMACSPDGKKIVVSNWDIDSTAQLIEIDIATGDENVLINGDNDLGEQIVYLEPVYSPDSKKVLFIRSHGPPYGIPRYDIYIYITPNILLMSKGFTPNPDWSPDGERVIWSSRHIALFGGESYDLIYIMTVNGDNSVVAIPRGSNPLWIE
jgi:Tol biopolymer transport system component